MQLESGFKQTEIGFIPEDWDIDFIENIALITTGSRNTQDRVEDGQYPFFVRSQKIERINSYSFDGEAVLTAGDGVGTGKIFHYINGKFDAHQRVYSLTNFNERINGYFFFLYFSNHFYNRIMQMTAKSSVDSVRRDMIARMLIPFPRKKAEQKAIATALSDADSLIDSLDLLIVKKHNIQNAIMQELMTGKRRIPGFSEEWELKRLGVLSSSSSGGTPLTSESTYYDGDIPWVSITDITKGGKIINKTDRNLTKKGYDNCSARIFPLGTVLYAMYASIGECSIAGIPLCSSQAILGICPTASLNNEFLYYFLTSLKPSIKKIGQQGTQANLNAGMVRNLTLSLPPLSEQSAIVTILSDMDAEIAALEKMRAKIVALKQGMMQELLTGRIRLI